MGRSNTLTKVKTNMSSSQILTEQKSDFKAFRKSTTLGNNLR